MNQEAAHSSMPFGVAYYPEQWPKDNLAHDIARMKIARVNTVRLGEFGWSQLEPEQGRYEFEWLDLAIEALHQDNIAVVLGTPTASPPPWLIAADPTILRMGGDGNRLSYGARREYCPNHRGYREHAASITSALATRYCNDQRVAAWQIDNELGGRCFCSNCAQAFHDWLKKRYGSLRDLNESWGTVFWSHTYREWSEIPVPLTTGGPHNPGLHLDYLRFQSDSYVAFQGEQIKLIRASADGTQPITHNMTGAFSDVDPFALAAELDFSSWDNYWLTQWNMESPPQPADRAFQHRAVRGTKRASYWVMEQQAGAGGWDVSAPTPRPGQMRLWAYQGLAHGADGLLFFRWRSARRGSEQFWHGVIDHHGNNGRRFDEFKQIGEEIEEIGLLVPPADSKAEVALLVSSDSQFAFEIQPNNPGHNYGAHTLMWHAVLHAKGIDVDIVDPSSDLEDYRIVVAPALHVVSQPLATKIEDFVHRGGVLITTFRTGVKDESNAVVEQPFPGLLSEVCGVEVEECDSLPRDKRNRVEIEGIGWFEVNSWCDVLVPNGAEIVARYDDDFYAGRAAITRHAFGDGHTFYVGAQGGGALHAAILDEALKIAGVQKGPELPPGIEWALRSGTNHSVAFLLNHNDYPVHLDSGPWTGRQLVLDGEATSDDGLQIPAYGVVCWVQPGLDSGPAGEK